MAKQRTYVVYNMRGDFTTHVQATDRRAALVVYGGVLRAAGVDCSVTQSKHGGRYVLESADGVRYGAHAA